MQKRLFFGAEVVAPWPLDYPQGRLIAPEARHLTLAFLGEADFSKLERLLPSLPLPSFIIGLAGKCDSLSFLPEKTPRVVAANAHLLEAKQQLSFYQQTLNAYLKTAGFTLDDRPFYPHVSLARSPFSQEEWLKAFSEFPFFLKGIHLYESLGNLLYEKIWTYSLIPPFEELEHTADIAFIIRGETLQKIHLHAEIALCFKCPSLIHFLIEKHEENLDDIIIALNALIARADEQIGVPFKAVSFHGEAKSKDTYLQWEMIVDV